jgi:TfoX/Sxy family transcriptional regulator of competence genes
MASNPRTVDFLIEQIGAAGTVCARKMFGEYGLYCDGKMVALVCEDQLFVKPTAAGERFVGEVTRTPPYKGAKHYLQIPVDRWDDAEWLSELVRISAGELPLPAKKRSTQHA